MYLHILGSKVCMCLHLQDFFFSRRERKEEISSTLVNLLTLVPAISCKSFQNFSFWLSFWYHTPSLSRQEWGEGAVDTLEGKATGRTGSAETSWHSTRTKSKSCHRDGLTPVMAERGAASGGSTVLNTCQQQTPSKSANSTWGCMKWSVCRRLVHQVISPFLSSHYAIHVYNAAASSLVSPSTGKSLVNWSKLSGGHQDGQGWRSQAWSSSLFSLKNSSPVGFSFVVLGFFPIVSYRQQISIIQKKKKDKKITPLCG